MRVNIYAEEITNNIEIVEKIINGVTYTGLRLYLYLPTTNPDGTQHQGPFIHNPGDDDSSAVTFWGKEATRYTFMNAIHKLDNHYATHQRPARKDSTDLRIPY